MGARTHFVGEVQGGDGGRPGVLRDAFAEGDATVVPLVAPLAAGTWVECWCDPDGAAPAAGLKVIASAAQGRTDWRGGPSRAEHLVAMRRI